MINYFGKEGLTLASATHICNLAKEYYTQLLSKIDNINLFEVQMSIIGSDIKETIQYATDNIDNIERTLIDVAEVKSLIAWLREAIKAKNNLTKDLADYSFSKYCKDNNIHYEFPNQEFPITEEEYLNSLSVKERDRYLSLETLASTIGKAIHSDGFFSKAKKDLTDIIQNPIQTVANGRDTLIYKRVPKYTTEEIDNIFYKLQDLHRGTQAALNGMKHQMEQAIEEDAAKKREAYSKALSEYKTREEEYRIKWQEYLASKREEIKKLKIVIPNNLRNIYDKINNL